MKIQRIYNDDHKSTGSAYMAITSTKSQKEVEAISDILDAKGWKEENTMCAEYGFGEWTLSYVLDLMDLNCIKNFKADFKAAKKAVK